MMLLRAIIVFALCLGCGLAEETRAIKAKAIGPCLINLTYNRTANFGDHDLVHYAGSGWSETCQGLLGKSTKRLRFKLSVYASRSAGLIKSVAIDNRTIELNSPLDSTAIVLDGLDTSKIDGGPLQMANVAAEFVFPRNAEAGLYPVKVELAISDQQ